MSYVNPIWLEGQRRRWQRHDWQRFIRHDAHRFMTPAGIEEEKRAAEVEKAARRKADEAAEAASRAELDALYADHLRVRALLADVKFELALRRIFHKYSPDQPRSPKGNPDGGQWMRDAGKVGPDDVDDTGASPAGRVLSDASPDPITPGARFAQNTTPRSYSVNLGEEETPKGIGHTLREHVGKSDDELLDIARKDWTRYTVGRFEITDFRLAHGSFASREAANDFVNRTLEDNQSRVDSVASGQEKEAILDKRFGYPTGREVFRPTGDSEPYVRDTYGVRVIIRHDPRSDQSYGVRTAFPINEDSKR